MGAHSLTASGHSAVVRMELRLNGHILPICQLGPNFIVLKETMDHPPAEAEIVMWIDGSESRWVVLLLEGIKSSQRKTPISRHQSACGYKQA